MAKSPPHSSCRLGQPIRTRRLETRNRQKSGTCLDEFGSPQARDNSPPLVWSGLFGVVPRIGRRLAHDAARQVRRGQARLWLSGHPTSAILLPLPPTSPKCMRNSGSGRVSGTKAKSMKSFCFHPSHLKHPCQMRRLTKPTRLQKPRSRTFSAIARLPLAPLATSRPT